MAVIDVECDDDILQNVIVTSGGQGPGVDPDHPVDPDEPILVNPNNVWDIS